MSLSRELQQGKAAEHLVCFDIIRKGHNAFLADQGLPFDVLVEQYGELKRIQVRSASQKHTYDKAKNVYRFGTRKGKGAITRARKAEVDYYAFVAMDIVRIAYIPISEMLAKTGMVKQTIDLREKHYDKYQEI